MFTSRLIRRRMRVGLAQIRFREDVSNFIGPTSIVLDDLVSDMRHRVDSGSYVYLSAKGAALVLFQQTTYPISSSHALTTACVRFAASSLSRIGADAPTFLPPHKDAGGLARRIVDLSVQCSARNMQQAADGGASGQRQRILGLLATF